ncbi:MAG: guanylate kinase [Alphaproteobacteria bacterium]|nr:guanylate kinase [Alphaproteobacteria bacterium]MBQ7285639.1 guanylate kinase [Alphaproteobacteria bacterium]
MNEIINRLKKVRKGAMFIIEAPSGTGKGTVAKRILAEDSNIKWSVSVTTRAPRPGEVDGVDYYFVTDEQYDEFLKQDAFYEYVDSQYGARYGTLRSEVDSFINVGQDVLFDMDWAGCRQMREKAGDDVVTIYLLPPSIKELRNRLINRGTDSPEVIEKRMGIILDKISHWNEFDYVIVNVDLDETVKKIQKIISGERMKRVRQIGMKGFVKELIKEVNNS